MKKFLERATARLFPFLAEAGLTIQGVNQNAPDSNGGRATESSR